MKSINLVAASLIVTVLVAVSAVGAPGEDPEAGMSCPEECDLSRQNCETACSQIKGGGAKAGKRRECERECADEREQCGYRCLHPTPKPTLRPERYHDKSCADACALKKSDCYQSCTKYTGGGAMGQKRAECRQDCESAESDCESWCVNPTPRPTREPSPYSGLSCPQICGQKLSDCEQGCSKFKGGGAKSQMRNRCISECGDINDSCLNDCSELPAQ